MICQSYFLVMLLINYQSFTNLILTDYQWVTNAIFMHYHCLANQFYPFITFPILLIWQLIILICCTNVLPIITNLTQCFTYPVHEWLSIICQFITTNHSIDKFLPIGSQCFTNYQFTNDTGKFTNNCQWFTIGSYWQWYIGGWGWGVYLIDKIR